MARNSIVMQAHPEAVFDLLDDPCAYPRWVVGARRVRSVDPTWPAVGSRFHHALGTAAGELHDSSKVLDRDRPNRLVLEVRFRPTGVARVEIRIVPAADGCEVLLEETMIDGPAARLPRRVIDPLLGLRNAVSLRRLRRESERAATSPHPKG